MTVASATNIISIAEMKKRVFDFNKKFASSEKVREQMQNTLNYMLKVAANKQFLSPSFAKNLKTEIDELEKKLKEDEFYSILSFFAEVAYYVWTHPEKEEKLIVEAKLQTGYSGQDLAYYFSGELGHLFQEATIPFNQFGLVWFIDYKNKKQKLNTGATWNEFCNFFVENFCDEPEEFKNAFEKVKVG